MVCSNKWCKSHFEPPTKDYEETQCPRCKSMQFELSGGVSWEEKKYEGERFDGSPHLIDIKVNRYYK